MDDPSGKYGTIYHMTALKQYMTSHYADVERMEIDISETSSPLPTSAHSDQSSMLSQLSENTAELHAGYFVTGKDLHNLLGSIQHCSANSNRPI